MTIALVAGQVKSAINSAGASTTLVVTLPNNPTPGNLVCVAYNTAGNTPTMTCADSAPNSYTLTTKSPFLGAAGRCGIFYLKNVPANGTKTITITSSLSIAQNFFGGWAAEFSGADTASPFENDATADSGANNTAITTPSYTSLADGELFFATCSAGTNISSADSPWTGVDVTQNGNYSEYTVRTLAGAQAVAYTQSPSSSWSGIVAAFKAATGGGLTPTPQFGVGITHILQSFRMVGY